MKAHYKVHSHSDLVQCDLCDRQFACKSSKVANQNTHMTKLYCDLCKPGTSKVYTSKNSLCLHVQGKHGEGWSAPCGATSDGSQNIPIILSWSVPSVPKLWCKRRSNVTTSQRKSKKKKFLKIVNSMVLVPK